MKTKIRLVRIYNEECKAFEGGSDFMQKPMTRNKEEWKRNNLIRKNKLRNNILYSEYVYECSIDRILRDKKSHEKKAVKSN